MRYLDVRKSVILDANRLGDEAHSDTLEQEDSSEYTGGQGTNRLFSSRDIEANLTGRENVLSHAEQRAVALQSILPLSTIRTEESLIDDALRELRDLQAIEAVDQAVSDQGHVAVRQAKVTENEDPQRHAEERVASEVINRLGNDAEGLRALREALDHSRVFEDLRGIQPTASPANSEPREKIVADAPDTLTTEPIAEEKRGQSQESAPEKSPLYATGLEPALAAEMEQFRARLKAFQAMGHEVVLVHSASMAWDGKVWIDPEVKLEAWQQSNLHSLSCDLRQAIGDGGITVFILSPKGLVCDSPYASTIEKSEVPLRLQLPPVSVRLEIVKDDNGKPAIKMVAYDWANRESPIICEEEVPLEPCMRADGGLFPEAMSKFLDRLQVEFPSEYSTRYDRFRNNKRDLNESRKQAA